MALASEGGAFRPVLVIANYIRLTGMSTLVPADRTCASSCAYIWLAGRVRMLDTNALIGFHGIFDERSGVPASHGNALLGTLLGHLGTGYDMVDWVVSALAGTMHWLTPETAKRYGIDYQADAGARATAAALDPEARRPGSYTGSGDRRFTVARAAQSARA